MHRKGSRTTLIKVATKQRTDDGSIGHSAGQPATTRSSPIIPRSRESIPPRRCAIRSPGTAWARAPYASRSIARQRYGHRHLRRHARSASRARTAPSHTAVPPRPTRMRHRGGERPDPPWTEPSKKSMHGTSNPRLNKSHRVTGVCTVPIEHVRSQWTGHRMRRWYAHARGRQLRARIDRINAPARARSELRSGRSAASHEQLV